MGEASDFTFWALQARAAILTGDIHEALDTRDLSSETEGNFKHLFLQ
jgi:hypothetical protein